MGGDFAEHHTRSHGPPAYTEMADDNTPPTHECFNKPGLLAARWINKLYQSGIGPLLACDANSSHILRSIPSQSIGDQGLLVCICEKCKKTFTIRVELREGHCRPETERTHHLVEDKIDESPSGDQLYPVISRKIFRCSATICSLAIHIEACKPRLPREWEADLLDRDAVQTRLKELMASDPNRFQDLMSPEKQRRLLPAYYLQAYLKDALVIPPPEKRTRVSVRNKFFSVNFAESFQPLLDLLGFQRIVEGNDQFLLLPWVEPPLSPTSVTPYASRRAWLEVIRAHLYCLLLKEPLQDQLSHDILPAAETKAWLTTKLDAEYSKTTFPNWSQFPEEAFDVLGAQKDMNEILLWYAAISQNQTNPSGREEVFQAVTRVTGGRETRCAKLGEFLEAEQMHAVTELSKKDPQATTPLSKAFRTFQLPETCTDEQLVVQWKELMIESQRDRTTQRTARHDLFIIGKARESYEVMQIAVQFDSEQEAANFLGVDLSMDPGRVVHETVAIDNEAWFDKTVVAAATRELAKAYASHPEVHQLLSYATELESSSGEPRLGGLPSASSADPTSAGNVDVSLPVGLQNIRNTCYLNSILQYFNTVLPVRDVILNWEQYKLEPTEDNINSRRLGGSGSALVEGEAFLAAKFVEEMRNLFVELQSSNMSFVRPRQRLAIAALKDANQLVKGNVAEKTTPFVGPLLPPPELPPRPSPKPSIETSDAPTEPTVSVNAVADNAETGSDVSSVTLVDHKDGEDNTYVELSDSIPPAIPAKERSALEEDDKEKTQENKSAERGRSAIRDGEPDTKMTGMNEAGDEPQTEDTRTIEEKIEAALNDKAVTGTDQQDIEEVMGNILEHLHGAIRPFSTDEHTGKQTDMITETFYWSSKKYIRDLDLKTGKASSAYRSIPDLSRWITAFPANEGKIDLYSALDSSFDREYQEINKVTTEAYTSITKPSPILHVYIQRSQNVNGRLGRNNNIVEIPEVLYLDRYMDDGEGSHVLKERQRSWDLKGRLRALSTPSAVVPPTTQVNSKGKNVQEAGFEVVDSNLDEFADAVMSIDTTGEGDGSEEYVSILDAETRKLLEDHQLLPSQPDGSVRNSIAAPQEAITVNLDYQASRRASAKIEEEKGHIKEELSRLFSSMRTVAYRLHAVICHGGGLGGGHYWVWIFDFQKHVWRKYNDERVEEYGESAKVLADLNNSHDPYYLAYVRENRVDDLVAIPERSAQAQAGTIGDGQAGSSSGDTGRRSSPLKDSHAPDSVVESMEVDADAAPDPDVMHVEDRDD